MIQSSARLSLAISSQYWPSASTSLTERSAFCSDDPGGVRPRRAKVWLAELHALNVHGTLIDEHRAQQRAISPNYFVFELCVRTAQKKFARRLKNRRGADSHPATGSIYDKAIARCRTWIDQDHPYLLDQMARRAAAISCRRDHRAPRRVAEAP